VGLALLLGTVAVVAFCGCLLRWDLIVPPDDTVTRPSA